MLKFVHGVPKCRYQMRPCLIQPSINCCMLTLQRSNHLPSLTSKGGQTLKPFMLKAEVKRPLPEKSSKVHFATCGSLLLAFADTCDVFKALRGEETSDVASQGRKALSENAACFKPLCDRRSSGVFRLNSLLSCCDADPP